MKLLEALAEVSRQDLDEIVAEMASLESRLSQLREVRKLIEIKLGITVSRLANFKGQRGKRKPREEVQHTVVSSVCGSESTEPDNSPRMAAQLTVTEQYRLDAKRYIMANGPAKPSRIANSCGIPQGSLGGVFKHKWFKQCEHGVDLTPEAFKTQST